MPTSFGVRRSSPRPALVYSLISASLVLLLVLSAGLLPPRTTATAPDGRLPDIMSEKNEEGVSPQQQKGGAYRANRVAAGNDFVKFVLQESVGSDGRVPAEAATWRTLNFREVAHLFKQGLPDCFLESMKEANFEAVFWESVPVTRTTTDKPYEYVLVDSPRLAAVRQMAVRSPNTSRPKKAPTTWYPSEISGETLGWSCRVGEGSSREPTTPTSPRSCEPHLATRW
ncbi:unnamed protein product [Ectocarpus sp. 12 AP-2014]